MTQLKKIFVSVWRRKKLIIKKLENAIKIAELNDFVYKLEKKSDTLVGDDGIRISGGQLQRIGIARALYHKPEVVVLDEATSSLDTPTEKGVMDAVNSLQGTKTIIIVAHRHTTVKKCNRVYRLQKGKIVEEDIP